MEGSKWRDHACTRARSESMSLSFGSDRRAPCRMKAARSKSFRSLASRAARSAWLEEADSCAAAAPARKRTRIATRPALQAGLASLLTGIHSLEGVTDEASG